MKVFLAGASGVLGRRIVPILVSHGHVVVAMSRSKEGAKQLASDGVQPVVADGLDAQSVMSAMQAARPDVVIHQMTSLTAIKGLRNFDKEFAQTNRLRTAGTDNLVAAARASGVQRVIAQSYAGWTYAPDRPGPKTEEDPFDPFPPHNQEQSLAAIKYLEDRVLHTSGLDGIVLRYTNLYGPGTAFAPDGAMVDLVRKRMMPLIGNSAGVWSFIHVEDAAVATVAAVEGGPKGAYNIADDAPVAVSTWLPALATILGAKKPLHIPTWIGRMLVGDVGISLLTRVQGVSNGKAKAELRWQPTYRDWRSGFSAVLERPSHNTPRS